MERRVLLAVLLSFAVLYGYQALFPAPPEPKPGAPAAHSGTTKPAAGAASQASATSAEAKPAPSPATASPGPASGTTPQMPDRDIPVHTPGVDGVFSSRGGVLKSWRLLKYHDEKGQPLELAAENAPEGAPKPFTLTTDDPQVAAELARASYTASADRIDVSAGTQTLSFDYNDGAGLVAHKALTFSASHPYRIVFSASITRNGQPLPVTVEWGPALGSGLVPKSRSYNPPPGELYFRDGKVTRVAAAKMGQGQEQDGTLGFAGVDDHYFLTAVVEPKQPLKVTFQPIQKQVPGAPEAAQYVTWSARFPSAPHDALYFVGPKDFDILAATDRDLVRSIDFGMWAWLVVPLLRALKWINTYTHNYGWSVVVLTVLINLAMFPLRHKSVVSMRKMQEIQPEVKAIQDRYSKLKMSDPARGKMNTEMMELYRSRGVNPASGCVPMLLTFPVLFAFYSLLAVAIELRGAPFILWIHDLSQPDPMYVLPVLMGVSMFVQTKMTPTTADPTQQMMMLIMPVVLTVTSFWWASGLLLYWTTANIWGIGQQMITNRIIGKPAVRHVRPPGERQLKRAGGGKTDQAAAKERK